jgi:hypothetical protein
MLASIIGGAWTAYLLICFFQEYKQRKVGLMLSAKVEADVGVSWASQCVRYCGCVYISWRDMSETRCVRDPGMGELLYTGSCAEGQGGGIIGGSSPLALDDACLLCSYPAGSPATVPLHPHASHACSCIVVDITIAMFEGWSPPVPEGPCWGCALQEHACQAEMVGWV